jgi:hypothetical protein
LSFGVTYKLKVQARNTEGFSNYSDEIEILSAEPPDAPFTPTTTIDGDNVIIDWITPQDNGSIILGYMIYIRESDLVTFTVDSTHCDG